MVIILSLIGSFLPAVRFVILVYVMAAPPIGFGNFPASEGECPVKKETRLAEIRGVATRGDIVSMIESGEKNLNHIGLVGVNLQYLDLTAFNLYGADLSEARLVGSKLANADLRCAILSNANLSRTGLQGAKIQGAFLTRADLSYADLQGANLSYSDLTRAVIKGVRLTDTTLESAVFAPVSSPSRDYVSGIKGIDTVTFPRGRQPGLVNIRQLFRDSNLRDLEREATYSIEKMIAYHDRQSTSMEKRIDGSMRLVLFQWTTGWGKNPLRALFYIGILWLCTTPLYFRAIVSPTPNLAIYRVSPSERLASHMREGVHLHPRAQILSKEPLPAAGWAMYFSLLSTFHIGWRDLNLGAWITRIQHREFLLRGYGWVRTVSGVQSFLCVFLVAVAALTYFGRPFG